MMKCFFIGLLTIICSVTYSQKAEEVSIVFYHGKITGELTNVSKENIVLIIPGSGPTDRNGNNQRMKNNSLKMLSDGLVANGISTLRIDKRGVGNSVFENLREEDVTIDTLIDDVHRWLNKLSMRMYKNIYVVGHSEGSLIGMIAAYNRNVKGFVSIAGAGTSADSIILKQISMLPSASLNKVSQYLDTLKRGYILNNVPKSFYMLFRPSVQPYMISWLNKDPKVEIAKLKIPILILNGDADLQVDTFEARKLYNSSTNADIHILSQTNHVLKKVKNIQENQKSYKDPLLPIDSRIVDIVSDFILK